MFYLSIIISVILKGTTGRRRGKTAGSTTLPHFLNATEHSWIADNLDLKLITVVNGKRKLVDIFRCIKYLKH